MARLYDINSNQSIDIGMHESGIQGLEWVAPNILATGSWDKTIKYWDLRSPQPAGVVNMPERVYAMGFGGGYLVAATADRNVTIINVNQPTNILKVMIYYHFSLINCIYIFYSKA
jgi:mRNA export factor